MKTIHILNVGKGNCIVAELPSGLGVIDIDDSSSGASEELTEPIGYIARLAKDGTVFRFVLTHPDMDHMSGLAKLSAKFTLLNFWDTNNSKKISDEDWEASPYDRADWDTYQRLRESQQDPKCLRLNAGATSECCWIGDGIGILSPTVGLEQLAAKSEEYNHLSYMLRLTHAGNRIMLSGDATPEAWDAIASNSGKESLKANVFIAPHHGSKNNVNKDVFSHISPEYVIVSVASGIEYDYDYYKSLATQQVLSTKAYGNLDVQFNDDGTYRIFYEHAPK